MFATNISEKLSLSMRELITTCTQIESGRLSWLLRLLKPSSCMSALIIHPLKIPGQMQSNSFWPDYAPFIPALFQNWNPLCIVCFSCIARAQHAAMDKEARPTSEAEQAGAAPHQDRNSLQPCACFLLTILVYVFNFDKWLEYPYAGLVNHSQVLRK